MSRQTETHVKIDNGASLTGSIGGIGKHYGPIYLGSTPPAFTMNLKYQADRLEQERRIAGALAGHLKNNARRPLVLVVHGTASQCLDTFVERLRIYTLKRHFKVLLGSDQLQAFSVRWPIASARAAEMREHDYREALAGQLELADADAPAIVERIGGFRCPVMLHSVHTEVDGDDDEETFRIVLDFWGRTTDLHTDLSLVIVVAFISAEPRAGLLGRFRARRRSELAARISGVMASAPSRISAVLLPELANVTLKDAEDWVRDVLRPFDVDLEETLRRAREAFSSPNSSMSMKQMAQHLGALVPRSREVFRQQ